MSNRQSYPWCTFQALNQTTLGSQYFSLVLQTIIWITFIITIFKALKKQFITGKRSIYGCLFIWMICNVAKTVLNILVFFYYIQIPEQTIYFQEQLAIFSTIFLILDFLCTFFLLTVMFLIPYYWIHNILNSIQEVPVLNAKKKILNFYFKGMKFFKFLLYLRVICMLLIIILIVLGEYIYYFQQFYQFIRYMPLVQSLFLVLIYYFGVLLCLKFENDINMSPWELKIIRRQYLILLFVSVLHFGLDLVLMYSIPQIPQQNQNCYIPEQNQYTIIFTIILYLNALLLQFLPGIIMIGIYYPTKRQFQSSYIGSSTTSPFIQS